MDDDDRYHNVLKEFGKFAQEFQEYKLAREQALSALEQRLIEQLGFYWRATAAGMRQLSDWFAETETQARKEREQERSKRSRREWIIIGLLIVAILVEIAVRFWR